VLALPYGGGGNTCAYALGFAEANAGMPRILAVQAVERSTTAASAIRIVEPAHAPRVDEALRSSDGALITVDDAAILEAWRWLASDEGVFCEPASAAGVAGLARTGLEPGTHVVCVVTGHGLKDPEAALRLTEPPIQVEPDADAIAALA
jgi:threonine synthase